MLSFVLPISLVALLVSPGVHTSLLSFLTMLALTLQSHSHYLFPSFSYRPNNFSLRDFAELVFDSSGKSFSKVFSKVFLAKSLAKSFLWEVFPLGSLTKVHLHPDPYSQLPLYMFIFIALNCNCFYLSLSLMFHCLCTL